MAKISKPIVIDDALPSNSANADFFYNSETRSLYYRDRKNHAWLPAITAEPGPQGEKGDQGDPGVGINLIDRLENVEDLPTSGNSYNDAYIVEANKHMYVWQYVEWFDMGQVVGFDGPQGPQGEQGIQGETGVVDTSQDHTWTGVQTFSADVSFNQNVIATLKINCFDNPTARSAVITAPSIGLLTFILQDDESVIVNRFEFWDGNAWSPIADPNAATLAGTETLTNKTMSGSSNTFSEIPVAAISGLDSALTSYASKYISVNQQTASYTLALSDDGSLIEMNVESDNTLTIPSNSSVEFPVGTQLVILQTGEGQTTLTADAGVALNGTPGLKLRIQWSSATIIKRATDSWIAIGDLAA